MKKIIVALVDFVDGWAGNGGERASVCERAGRIWTAAAASRGAGAVRYGCADCRRNVRRRCGSGASRTTGCINGCEQPNELPAMKYIWEK